MDQWIRIRGARQHNLKNLDLDLPRRLLTVVTGPSGSGKSSLALDTLFAEGQRRYVESLSTYAKQFLDRMEKPLVDHIEGIAPAVAIEQKNPTKTSRSTVGTATEVFDYLRLLWARVGRTHCPDCGEEVRPDTVSEATDRVLSLNEGARILVTFPLKLSDRVTHALVVENLRAMGFLRVLADGEMVDIGGGDSEDVSTLGLDLTVARELLVVVDRLKVNADIRDRLADSLGTCFAEGEGEASVVVADPVRGEGPGRLGFTEHFRCPRHPDRDFPEPTPQLFSFNNPYGSCGTCTGFGSTLEYDEQLILPNPQRSIQEGAVDPWTKPRYFKEQDRLRALTQDWGLSLFAPWEELPDDFKHVVLHGRKGFQGLIPFLKSKEKKRYKRYIRVFLRQYQSPRVCEACGGSRIRPEALWVKVGGEDISRVSSIPLEDLAGWVRDLALSETDARIAETILRELRARLSFLVEVGLGYLTLERQTRTLSGGEAQRINLANSLGSSLVDALYVLDEPTIGLHPKDTDALLQLLGRLRDSGNTVIVVEHDPQAIQQADHIVELGPGSGEQGGEVVFEGTPTELREARTTTGLYLSGREEIPIPGERRSVHGNRLNLKGARLHNLRDVEAEFPLGALTVVTGVSGSGKSTLIHDVLHRALEQELGGGENSAKEHLGEAVGEYSRLDGAGHLEAVVLVDQTPIGRTPRSNPVTYIKAWDEVRRIFSTLPISRQRGYGPGAFSFNVKGGRCEECKGAGRVEVEMIFMADVFVPCDFCGGRRYKPELLEVVYKGLNVAQVLELTVDQAIRFFMKEDRLGQILWHLQQVGLGYLRLGQPATTLSGGEAQRLKIARELSSGAGKKGRKIYILDEPTTGLSGDDIRKLLSVLGRLIDAGHTVVVIEHNLDFIKTADWVVDLGPGAGSKGGEVVAMGRPEDIVGVPESYTGQFLQPLLSGLLPEGEGVEKGRVPTRAGGGAPVTMSSPPPVSVILPVRDGEAVVADAIESVLEQTFSAFELLVVDDGSVDGTRGIVRDLAATDPRIRLLTQEASGIVAALEAGRGEARGRYLARMDADDIALPARLKAQLALIQRDSRLVVVGTQIAYFPRDRVQVGALRYEGWINSLTSHEAIARDIFVECPLPHPTFLMRADAVDLIGGYRDFGWPEDYDLLLRLWEAGGRFGKVPSVLLKWREGPLRLSRTQATYNEEAFRRCKVRYLLKTHLQGGRGVVVWGAGPIGKGFARELQAQGGRLVAFVDLDPRRIGQEIYGVPVIHPEDGNRYRGSFAVAAVGKGRAREEIRDDLSELGWKETEDFVAVA